MQFNLKGRTERSDINKGHLNYERDGELGGQLCGGVLSMRSTGNV